MSLNVHGLEEMSQQQRRDQLSWGKSKQIDWLNLSQTSFGKVESLLFLLICLKVSFRLLCRPSADSGELKHQTFLVPRTPTGSIFAAWQPLRMSRRSWAAVTDFKTRVLRLKPGVQILGSSKNIRHTKAEILRLKSYFLRKKETNFTQIFERHFQMNYSDGVRNGFTLVCLMICIWRVNRVPDPVLRGQPCRPWIKNVWCLSSLISIRNTFYLKVLVSWCASGVSFGPLLFNFFH